MQLVALMVDYTQLSYHSLVWYQDLALLVVAELLQERVTVEGGFVCSLHSQLTGE